jgi:hypothetical protein
MGGICFEVGLTGYTARENAGYIFFSIIFLFLGSMVASARRSKYFAMFFQFFSYRLKIWGSSFFTAPYVHNWYSIIWQNVVKKDSSSGGCNTAGSLDDK